MNTQISRFNWLILNCLAILIIFCSVIQGRIVYATSLDKDEEEITIDELKRRDFGAWEIFTKKLIRAKHKHKHKEIMFHKHKIIYNNKNKNIHIYVVHLDKNKNPISDRQYKFDPTTKKITSTLGQKSHDRSKSTFKALHPYDYFTQPTNEITHSKIKISAQQHEILALYTESLKLRDEKEARKKINKGLDKAKKNLNKEELELKKKELNIKYEFMRREWNKGNLFEAFGIPYDASERDIREKRKSILRDFHSDINLKKYGFNSSKIRGINDFIGKVNPQLEMMQHDRDVLVKFFNNVKATIGLASTVTKNHTGRYQNDNGDWIISNYSMRGTTTSAADTATIKITRTGTYPGTVTFTYKKDLSSIKNTQKELNDKIKHAQEQSNKKITKQQKKVQGLSDKLDDVKKAIDLINVNIDQIKNQFNKKKSSSTSNATLQDKSQTMPKLQQQKSYNTKSLFKPNIETKIVKQPKPSLDIDQQQKSKAIKIPQNDFITQDKKSDSLSTQNKEEEDDDIEIEAN